MERSVEYVRRKTFAFKDHFGNLQQAQSYLQSRLGELNQRTLTGQQQSPYAGLELERKGLYAYPGCMESFSGENLNWTNMRPSVLPLIAIRYLTI